MIRRFLAVVVLAMAALALGVGGAQAVTIKKVTSPGGITAWLVEDHTLPLVSMDVGFLGGAATDPTGKSGLANFTADLLDEGAGELDSTAYKGRLEDLASAVAFNVDNDMTEVSLRTLASNFEASAELVNLSLTQPRFADDAVARVRGQLLSSLARRGSDPNYVAGRLWWKSEMGDHPYARPRQGTPESVAAIVPDDMRRFMTDRIARDVMLIGVVGDITPEKLAPLLDKTFGNLPAKAAPAGIGVAKPRDTAALLLNVMPIPQSVVVFGQPGIKRDDKDWYAAYIVSHILGGGGLTSRLSLEVREKRGLAYSVYAGLNPMQHGGVILGGVATENARLGESVDIIRAEWKRMRDDGPTAEELAKAKTYLTGSFALGFDSTLRIAGLLVVMQRDNLGIDYLDHRNALINGVTLAEAKRVSKKLFNPDALDFVVVGSPENLKGATRVGVNGDEIK